MDDYIPKKISVPIDKEWVLQHISEESIIAKFLPCSLTDIAECCNYNKLISNPMRTDHNPSMGMRKYTNGKLWVRDFNGSFNGDCFDIVERRLQNISIGTPTFIQVLETVLAAFGIGNYTAPKPIELLMRHKEVTEFHVEYRDENNSDINYWNRINIDIARLERFNVFFIWRIISHNTVIYTYKPSDPCYGYFFGYDKDGIAIWKFYFPYRKNSNLPRFLCNFPMIEGGKYIKEAEYGLITKSYKDVMVADVIGINAIAPSAESILLTAIQMQYVRKHWKKVFTLSDFDRAGILFGLRMSKLHNTTPLFLTNGNFDSIDFGAKDLAEYIEAYKIEQLLELKDYLLTNGTNWDSDWIDFCYNYLEHK